MYSKPYQSDRLSALGMGNMRLPAKGEGWGAPIDYDKAEQIIDFAMQSGINYYDTAHVYNNGGSEAFLGKAMKKYPRDSFRFATKYNSMGGPDYQKIFQQQLDRLQTDYVDFYLIHAVMNEESAETYINSGCIEYFLEQKKLGRIRHLGFSSHAPVETLRRFADHHQWDFAQIQLNYLDWTLQDAKTQYEILTERGIPVMVMEPVRGGRLASLSPEANKLLQNAHPDWSIASWAFRWVMRLPNVQVILSGMSTLGQIQDNVKTFESYQPLSDEETKLLETACEMFRSEISVPCTGCRYCCDGCPQHIEIPAVLKVYNDFKLSGPMALGSLGKLEKTPKDCIGCGSCTRHCPQGIAVPDLMAELAEAMKRMPGPPKP